MDASPLRVAAETNFGDFAVTHLYFVEIRLHVKVRVKNRIFSNNNILQCNLDYILCSTLKHIINKVTCNKYKI